MDFKVDSRIKPARFQKTSSNLAGLLPKWFKTSVLTHQDSGLLTGDSLKNPTRTGWDFR
jgi:hypothetical protein